MGQEQKSRALYLLDQKGSADENDYVSNRWYLKFMNLIVTETKHNRRYCAVKKINNTPAGISELVNLLFFKLKRFLSLAIFAGSFAFLLGIVQAISAQE